MVETTNDIVFSYISENKSKENTETQLRYAHFVSSIISMR